MNENSGFSPSALCLGVVTAAVGECVLRTGTAASARAVLLWGFWQALALVLLCVLAAVALPDRGAASRLASAVLAFWILWELAETLFQAQTLCRQQFASVAVFGLAPFLMWFGWKRAPEELNHAARILWWFALCGAVVCLLGLGGQMRWQRLFASESTALPPVKIYAEYLAFPLLCPRQTRVLRRAAWLPLGAFAVQAAFCTGMELLFGAMENSGYAGFELLRALSVGAFSRLDAFLLLIWLVLALFRVCFLCAAVHRLWQSAAAVRRTGDGLC